MKTLTKNNKNSWQTGENKKKKLVNSINILIKNRQFRILENGVIKLKKSL